MSAIFKDQGKIVVMVKPNIWYLKALSVRFTGHPHCKTVTYMVSEINLNIMSTTVDKSLFLGPRT